MPSPSWYVPGCTCYIQRTKIRNTTSMIHFSRGDVSQGPNKDSYRSLASLRALNIMEFLANSHVSKSCISWTFCLQTHVFKM